MTKSTDTHLIGWDIGGAHLKAARVDNGRVTGVVQIACPLWQGLDRLDAALAQARSALGASNRHAVTMTGEMVDLFDSRTGGVIGITQHLEANLPGAITLFAGRAGWLAPAQAADHADDIASANWLATAEWVATHCAQALLVDIGSTTSDLIVIDHGVAGTSRSDADRLISGELVYAGVVRTPLMALAQKIGFKGRTYRVMAEHFATTADVWRLLGLLPEGADHYPTGDGGMKTPEASARRIARMIGRDMAEGPIDDWRALAGAFADAQIATLVDAAGTLPGIASLPADAPVVCAGAGHFAAVELARQLGRPALPLQQLLADHCTDDCAGDASTCAPAVAVALLAAG